MSVGREAKAGDSWAERARQRILLRTEYRAGLLRSGIPPPHFGYVILFAFAVIHDLVGMAFLRLFFIFKPGKRR